MTTNRFKYYYQYTNYFLYNSTAHNRCDTKHSDHNERDNYYWSYRIRQVVYCYFRENTSTKTNIIKTRYRVMQAHVIVNSLFMLDLVLMGHTLNSFSLGRLCVNIRIIHDRERRFHVDIFTDRSPPSKHNVCACMSPKRAFPRRKRLLCRVGEG